MGTQEACVKMRVPVQNGTELGKLRMIGATLRLTVTMHCSVLGTRALHLLNLGSVVMLLSLSVSKGSIGNRHQEILSRNNIHHQGGKTLLLFSLYPQQQEGHKIRIAFT